MSICVECDWDLFGTLPFSYVESFKVCDMFVRFPGVFVIIVTKPFYEIFGNSICIVLIDYSFDLILNGAKIEN